MVEVINGTVSKKDSLDFDVDDLVNKLESKEFEDIDDLDDDKKDKKDDEDIEIDNEDIETEDDEDEDEEDDEDKENKNKDDEDEEEEESEDQEIVLTDDYKEAQRGLKYLNREIKSLHDDIEVLRPKKSDYDDEEEFEEAQREYKKDKRLISRKIEKKQSERVDFIKDLQKEFIKSCGDRDLSGFAEWLKAKEGILADIIAGNSDLMEFYDLWRIKTGQTKTSNTEVKKTIVKKKKVKSSTLPGVESKGSDDESKGNVLPKKYVYANKKEMRQYAKSLLATAKSGKYTAAQDAYLQMKGKDRFDNNDIEALCKDAYLDYKK